MRFTKIHALGNDFVVLGPESAPQPGAAAELARKICDRHTGVGADGILILGRSDKPGDGGTAAFTFKIFNADGSEAELSGNGLRCAMAFLVHHGVVETPSALFRTSAGDRTCELIKAAPPAFELRTSMGTPRFASEDIPFDDGRSHETLVDYPLTINGKIQLVTCVSVGNPQCDIFVDRFPARIEWHQIGREVESHPFFPHRTNVGFVRVLNRDEIEVFFWERGVGETLASGTGACGAAVTAMLKGLTERKVRVFTILGELIVEWPKDGQVFQTGPAEVVFEGQYPAA